MRRGQELDDDTLSGALPDTTLPHSRRRRDSRKDRDRRHARGLPSGSTGARSLRQAARPGGTIGSGYLALGAAIFTGVEALSGIVLFGARIHQALNPWPSIMAWALFWVAAVIVTSIVVRSGERLSGTGFGCVCVVLAAVLALDTIGCWPEHDFAHTATAAITAGFALIPFAMLRPAREVGTAIVVFSVAFCAILAVSSPLTMSTIPAALSFLSIAVLPPALAVMVMVRFRQFVQRQLDRVLVQSTVTAPIRAVGMRASDELARLDLAAERLLKSVASGDEPLPLSEKSSQIAASLATELRLHLIEGQRETWLFHAITESDHLGRTVRVADPGYLAGQLSAAQRDGLLQIIWHLVGDGRAPHSGAPLVSVTLGPVGIDGYPLTDDTMDVPIVIESSGSSRRKLGPAAWAALARIGAYSDAVHDRVLRITVHCVVARHPSI